jgi:hypothetical protein
MCCAIRQTQVRGCRSWHRQKLDSQQSPPMPLLRHSFVRSALPTTLLFCAMTACTGGGGACEEPTTALVPSAMNAYLAAVKPTPRRFLIAAGTDSALPGSGESQLQRRGPTYVFPADVALQKRVLNRLDSVARVYGDMPTLLVTYRGMQRVGKRQAIVRFGGYFLGGVNDGKIAHRVVQFACEKNRWNAVRAQEERQS